MIKLIVAIDKNKLIGIGNKLPWNIPSELKFFKNKTIGDALLMGGNTFKGLPGKLPNRKHIVFSRMNISNADENINSLKELKKIFLKYNNSDEVLWIVGGKFIYENFYQEASEIYISIINQEYIGDVYLNINLKDYKKIKYKTEEEFTVYKYTK